MSKGGKVLKWFLSVLLCLLMLACQLLEMSCGFTITTLININNPKKGA